MIFSTSAATRCWRCGWRRGSKSDSGDRWPCRTCSGINDRAACRAASGAGCLAGGSPLVDLGTAGPGQPLILVHPIGGGVLCYNALARSLDGARTSWGSRRMAWRARRNTRRTSCAWRHDTSRPSPSASARTLSPGRVVDGGHRGVRDGQATHAAGAEVPLVFLIDSSVPTPARSPGSLDDREPWSSSLPTWRAPRAATWASLEQLRGLDFEAMRNGNLARAIEGSEIAREIGAERLQRLHHVYRANRLALEGYEPRPIGSRDPDPRGIEPGIFDDDSARGWNASPRVASRPTISPATITRSCSGRLSKGLPKSSRVRSNASTTTERSNFDESHAVLAPIFAAVR